MDTHCLAQGGFTYSALCSPPSPPSQCMNAICLQSALEQLGVETRVQTAIEMQARALHSLRFAHFFPLVCWGWAAGGGGTGADGIADAYASERWQWGVGGAAKTPSQWLRH